MRLGRPRPRYSRHISDPRHSASQSFHLSPVGKPPPPRPRRPAVKEGLDHIVRSHLGENLAQGLIAAGSDVLIDIFRVDDTAVAQGNTVLFLIEVRVA